MAKAKLNKFAPALNTAQDSVSVLILRGMDFVDKMTVTIVHTDSATKKKCTWTGKISKTQSQSRQAIVTDLKAARDPGYPDPLRSTRGTEDVSVTVTIQGADPPTTTTSVDLYTE